MNQADRRIVSEKSEGSLLLSRGLYSTKEDLEKERQRLISID